MTSVGKKLSTFNFRNKSPKKKSDDTDMIYVSILIPISNQQDPVKGITLIDAYRLQSFDLSLNASNFVYNFIDRT